MLDCSGMRAINFKKRRRYVERWIPENVNDYLADLGGEGVRREGGRKMSYGPRQSRKGEGGRRKEGGRRGERYMAVMKR